MSQDRLSVLYKHLHPEDGPNHESQLQLNNTFAPHNKKDKKLLDVKHNKRTLKVTDSESGKTIEIPVEFGAINATDLGKLGVRSLDPGYMNTAVCKSEVCFIDGDEGILRYRGYNIEELAEKSTFLEVSYLLINGELPSKKQNTDWSDRVMKHTYLHENLTQLLKQFRYDAHPMGMVISTLAALSTFYPYANPSLSGENLYKSEEARNKQIFRIIGKLPTIAACAYRNRIGKPYNNPVSNLGYTENFLYMLDKLSENDYKPNPVLARALDKLFIIHADHELNCSTAAMRHLASTKVDPYTAMAGAAGALYGPLHGGACEAVLHMLEDIGSLENVPNFIQQVKNKSKKLMGFGHRVYKSYDPRAKIARKIADEVFAAIGKEPMIEIAIELEKIALNDPYFIERKLYPNVDFYTGLVYRSMGFPTDMFPVLFCIPRAAGWLAHWVELLDDPATHIYRPRQVYLGYDERPYVDTDKRKEYETRELGSYVSPMSRRRETDPEKKLSNKGANKQY